MCSDLCIEKKEEKELNQTFNFVYMDKSPSYKYKNYENMFL